MSSSSGGQIDPIPVAPKEIAAIPGVSSLRVDYYPPHRLTLVDTRAYPVLCVGWSKGATDREAVTAVISGKGLPIPVSADASVMPLVRNDRRPNSVEAHQVWIDPDAPNLAVVTGVGKSSTSRESLWWLSPQGVRYGISQDQDTMRALGLESSSGTSGSGSVAAVAGVCDGCGVEPGRGVGGRGFGDRAAGPRRIGTKINMSTLIDRM